MNRRPDSRLIRLSHLLNSRTSRRSWTARAAACRDRDAPAHSTASGSASAWACMTTSKIGNARCYSIDRSWRIIRTDDADTAVLRLLPVVVLAAGAHRARGAHFKAAASGFMSRPLWSPDRRRRVLQQAQEIGLPGRVGFEENALQMGTRGWLTDAEHVGRLLGAQPLGKC